MKNKKELFKQVRIIELSQVVINYNELDIEFSVKQSVEDNEKGSDIATITIYNLSELTKGKINKNDTVTITAGYVDNNGVIYNGIIENIEHIQVGNDIATVITSTPNNFLYTNTIVNEQFQKGVSAKEILQLIAKKIPFNIDIKDLKKDVVYNNGKAFSNRLSNVIDIIARDTESITRLNNNTIEFKRKDRTYSSIINLNANNGLISVQKQKLTQENGDEENIEKYRVETLLIPEVKIGQILNVESVFYTGKLEVKAIEYKAKNLEEFSTVALCEVVK